VSLQIVVDGVDRTGVAWSPARLAWGREHPQESLDPRRLVLSFDGVTRFARGQWVTVAADAPATNPQWQDMVGPWSGAVGTWISQRVTLDLFTGRITDTATSWQPIDGPPATAWETLVDVIAVDPLGDVAGLTVGDVPWPAESAHERAQRIANLTGMLAWTVDPAPQPVAARDVDAQSALDLLDDVASWVSLSGGVWFDPLTGTAVWLTDASRSTRVPAVTLSAHEVQTTARLVESPTDLVNEFTATYRDAANPDALPEVTRRDDVSIADNGRARSSRTTDLTAEADADALALEVVARFAYVTPRLVDVTVRLGMLDRARRQTLLGLGPRARVHVDDLPAPAPASWAGYVEGWALDITGPDVDEWDVTLTLSPASWSGPLLPWADVPATLTWAAASTSWHDSTDTLT
jgi:hypothetical protein